MKGFLFTTMLSCVAVMQLAAQGITGKVTDKQGNAVAYANVMLYSLPDTVFVRGAVSGNDGTFRMDADCDGGIVKVTLVGYKPVFKACNGDNVGIIVMIEDSKMLGEVVVKGTKPQYSMTAEGLTTNVQGTVLSKMGTAEDVLKHVPSVIKKKDGYEVFGKGAPLIYINERKLNDISELDNLKSGDIKSVEVIRNPGARYDASVGSVIRIRTVKIKGDGFSFDMRSGYKNNGWSNTIQQMNMNYRHDGLNLFGTYKYSNQMRAQESVLHQTTNVDTLWQQVNNVYAPSRYEWHTAIGGFSYDFNANHSIGARYAIMLKSYSKGTVMFKSKVFANGKFYDSIYSSQYDTSDDAPIHEANVYYNGTIGKTTIDFNTDLYFSNANSYSTQNEVSQEHESRQVNSKNMVDNRMVASKIIVGTPLFGGSLSVGAEYVNTSRHDDYEVNLTTLLSNSYSLLKEQTVSPFIKYSHSTNIGNFTAGLRYEHVRFKYYDGGVYKPEQSRTFHNLFPSLSYATRVGKVMMQLSYSVKTKRPSYSQLSNNISYANRFTMQTGNPHLKNAINHQVELMGTWKFMQFMLSYKDSRDAIIFWAEQMPEHESVTVLSHKNEKSIKNFTAYVSMAPKIGFWSPQLNLGIQKQWLTLNTSMGSCRLNRPVVMGNFNNALTLPWGLMLNVDFAFQGKGNATNYKLTKNQYVLNAGLRKSFLGDELTVELNGNDLLYQQWDGGILYNPKMQIEQVNRYKTRSVSITLRYKFNTAKSKYKGTGAGTAERQRL